MHNEEVNYREQTLLAFGLIAGSLPYLFRGGFCFRNTGFEYLSEEFSPFRLVIRRYFYPRSTGAEMVSAALMFFA